MAEERKRKEKEGKGRRKERREKNQNIKQFPINTIPTHTRTHTLIY